MGRKNEKRKKPKKPANSYCMLQRMMDEVQKSKKPNQVQTSSSSKNHQNSNSSCKSSCSSKTISNKNLKNAPAKEKESTSGKKKEKEINNPNIPDHLYGDYFCSICDSHMNSYAMWMTHIIGKRHLKNVKNGDADSRYEDVDIESNVKSEIKNIKVPVVGLSYIHEIRKEMGASILYTCFLCKSCFPTARIVVEHVISIKHRLNYIKENSPDDHQLLSATDLKKAYLEPLVHEVAFKLELIFGRGSVKVKQEKTKPSFLFPKKAYDSDDDDDVPKKLHKNQEQEEKEDPYVWKPIDYSEQDSFKAGQENVKYSRKIIKDKISSVCSSDDGVNGFESYDYTMQPIYDNHISEYVSPTLPSRDSVERENFYHRTPPHTVPEECSHSSTFSSSLQETLRKECSRTPPYVLTEEYYSHSCFNERYENVSHSKDYPISFETKVENSGSNSLVTNDFVENIYALPTEIFLKVVLLKLDNMKVNGINELSLLSKVKNKTEAFLCNKLLPDDVQQTVLKQKVKQNSESSVQKSSATQSVMPRVTERSSFSTATNVKPSSLLQGLDLSFIDHILNQARSNVDSSSASSSSSSSSSQNTALDQKSYQSTLSYQSSSYQNGNTASSNVSYLYNDTPSSTVDIPGLTLMEENGQTQSSFNTYQPDDLDPVPRYFTYRY